MSELPRSKSQESVAGSSSPREKEAKTTSWGEEKGNSQAKLLRSRNERSARQLTTLELRELEDMRVSETFTRLKKSSGTFSEFTIPNSSNTEFEEKFTSKNIAKNDFVNITWHRVVPYTRKQSVVFELEFKDERENLLRSYRHFKELHHKLDEYFPNFTKENGLPKATVPTSKSFLLEMSPNFKKEINPSLRENLQEYLNRLVSFPEIRESNCFATFLDPDHNPLLCSIKNPTKQGVLKMSGWVGFGWSERWVILQASNLFVFQDSQMEYAEPLGCIRLRYVVIDSNASNKTDFKLRSWDGDKEYTFKAEEGERDEWVLCLRKTKVENEKLLTKKIESTIMRTLNNVKNYESLENYKATKPKGIHRESSMGSLVFGEKDDPSNFLFNQEKKLIRGGTVEKLLEKLTEEEQDMDFVLTFVLTYRTFTTPQKLLATCLKRFREPPARKQFADSPSLEQDSRQLPIHPTQLRVCTVLSKWVELNYHDFLENETLAQQLENFIETDLESNTKFQKVAKKIKDIRNKKLNHIAPQPNEEFLTNCPSPELPYLFRVDTFDLFDLSSLECARQLTLIEFNLFKKIEPKECLGQKWNKDKSQSPNITSVIRRFNQMSCWVITKVLQVEEVKPRAAMVAKFIEIANHCINLNNYNTSMQIISGLNSASIFRMSRTWDALSSSNSSMLNKIKDLLSVNQNYKNLRELLHTRQPPCVPYFGLYLTDLTFVDEGNPDIIENGLIFFEKNYMLYKVIKEILLYQQTPYQLLPVHEIQQFLTKSSEAILDENEAYSLSLALEPRNRTTSDIQ